MKLFKKFFGWIVNTGKKIRNSRGFEFFIFAHNAVVTAIEWADVTKEFVEMLKNVGGTLLIVGKFLVKSIIGFGSKATKSVVKFAQ